MHGTQLNQQENHSAERGKPGDCLTRFQRELLKKALRDDLPDRYHQRIEIMLLADQGKSQTEICSVLACSPSTARHWMLMACTGRAHRWRENPIGRPKQVTEAYRQRLGELVSRHPKDCGYSFERWSAKWLSRRLARELGISLSDRHVSRLLKQMGLSTRAPRARQQNGSDSSAAVSPVDSLAIVIRHLQPVAAADCQPREGNPFELL